MYRHGVIAVLVLLWAALAIHATGNPDADPAWFSWGTKTAVDQKPPQGNTPGNSAVSRTDSNAPSLPGLANHEEWIQSIRKQTEEELAMLDYGKRAIQKYESRGVDCYRDAAVTLQQGCRELTVSQEEKISYACLHGTVGNSCIEALAQVPQLWTSYSGYFRDVMAMCYAVRHHIERELVESLFYNLTLTQLVNNNMLKQHTADVVQLHMQEMAAWRQLHDQQSTIASQTDQIVGWTRDLSSNVTHLAGDLAAARNVVDGIERAQEEVKARFDAWRDESAAWMAHVQRETRAAQTALTTVTTDLDTVRSKVADVSAGQVEARDAVVQLVHWIDMFKQVAENQTTVLVQSFETLNQLSESHHERWRRFTDQQFAWVTAVHEQTTALVTEQHVALQRMTDEFRAMEAMQAQVHTQVQEMATAVATQREQEQERIEQMAGSLDKLHQSVEATSKHVGFVVDLAGLLVGAADSVRSVAAPVVAVFVAVVAGVVLLSPKRLSGLVIVGGAVIWVTRSWASLVPSFSLSPFLVPNATTSAGPADPLPVDDRPWTNPSVAAVVMEVGSLPSLVIVLVAFLVFLLVLFALLVVTFTVRLWTRQTRSKRAVVEVVPYSYGAGTDLADYSGEEDL
ncbi:hypothetical protein AMAG_04937 [Allomyces macrogynus ATCC 38327]|uniref:Nuclear fusion protein KAR5 n=1 Tax=Allomyces macrogynus (strain ATCC 38327) TaxID=578462 RepID=A0A0L0S715_ALLM3|nr:hypothetical protein AMAG_04937 [Allomyces macrogynus ATCC 38327]|eukprot:KNE58119.1 hypothetical protein AMAG_04937 [Allomyces macrogynus ATCC 38327]